MSVEELDTSPLPYGELALQTIAMPKDTNANGDIFGGWLLSQMDLAGSITASELAEGRVATVAIEGMSFLTPVHVGAVVSCYCDVLETGRSSVRILVEVWINAKQDGELAILLRVNPDLHKNAHRTSTGFQNITVTTHYRANMNGRQKRHTLNSNCCHTAFGQL